jgi:hypothetical protein
LAELFEVPAQPSHLPTLARSRKSAVAGTPAVVALAL